MFDVYHNSRRKPKKFILTQKEWAMFILAAFVLGWCAGFLSGLVIGVDKGYEKGIETAVVD